MYIKQIAFAMPVNILTVSQLAAHGQLTTLEASVFERLFGLQMIPRDEHIKVDELLLQAARNCLQQATVDIEKVKLLLHTHTATQIAPCSHSPIRQVQKELAAHQAIAFGMTMHKCATPFKLFPFLHQYLTQLNDDEYILLLIGDIAFTAILQSIPGSTINADSACAILLSKQQKEHRFIAAENITRGEYAAGIWANDDMQKQFEADYPILLAKAIQSVLQAHQLSLHDVALILPHNVNTISWHKVAKRLNILPQKIYLKNVKQFAHCFGADPFINLQTAIEDGSLRKNDFYVLATVGLGATFSAMLFQY